MRVNQVFQGRKVYSSRASFEQQLYILRCIGWNVNDVFRCVEMNMAAFVQYVQYWVVIQSDFCRNNRLYLQQKDTSDKDITWGNLCRH